MHGLATDEVDPRGAPSALDVTVELEETVLREHADLLDASSGGALAPDAADDGAAARPRAADGAELDAWVTSELRAQLHGAEARPWAGPLG